MKALNHYLHEIEVVQLEHGHVVGREWDEKVHGFRFGLESTLGNWPGNITINSVLSRTPKRAMILRIPYSDPFRRSREDLSQCT
jgi:hypothetical protein